MEEAIIALILGNPAVAAMIGDRANWSQRPGDQLPAVTLHRISGNRDTTLSGRSGLVSSTVQIDCWGATYKDAKLLARAIIPALPHAPSTTGGIVLHGVFIDSESDTFEGNDPTPIHRTRLDISVWHDETQEV